ncbi:Hypothetical predicted protein, partial [Marmota monax]
RRDEVNIYKLLGRADTLKCLASWRLCTYNDHTRKASAPGHAHDFAISSSPLIRQCGWRLGDQ